MGFRFSDVLEFVFDWIFFCVCLIYWLLQLMSKSLAPFVPNKVKQSVLVQNFMQLALSVQEFLASLVINRVKQIYSLHFKHQPHSVQGLLLIINRVLTQKIAGSSEVIKLYKTVVGNDKNCHEDFLKSLSVNFQEVFSVDQSDVMIVFVPIVSRAGTDIEAALQTIPDHPVVLVVLHHTFDPDCIVPESRNIYGKSNVWLLDCLFHEDKGLLKCHRNTKALEEAANYLQDARKAINRK